MTITESTRHQLHQALIASLGEEEASTLMEHLPPVGWADVATKTDIENLRAATSAEFTNVRLEIENLRIATQGDIANLRIATKADITSVNDKLDTTAAQIRAELATQLKSSERWIVTAMFGFNTVLGTVLGVLIAIR